MSCNLKKVIERLIKFYNFNPKPEDFLAIKALKEGMHPFGILVSIILTQNTSDRNALIAFKKLQQNLGYKLEPKYFEKITQRELAELIKPSGMQYQKARTIKNILEAFHSSGYIELVSEDPEMLRNKLLSVKGIGPKTADVFLLTVRGYPTFPIDTHIRRVLTRIGCIEPKETYESIREKVLKELPSHMLLKAHIILIIHGRSICKSRKPKCNLCPLRDLCKHYLSKKPTTNFL